MAAREVLKYPMVKNITLVDLDKAMTELFSHASRFTELNHHALSDPRVHIVNQDAYQWLKSQSLQTLYDVIIIDLPDPSQYSLAKLYSVSMYHQVKQLLTADGLVVVQSTSPYYSPQSFWSINETLKTATFRTAPYHLYVPSFGEWGFIIAFRQRRQAFSPPSKYQVKTQFLTPQISQAMFTFPADMQVFGVLANTLDKQPLVRYYHEDWSDER